MLCTLRSHWVSSLCHIRSASQTGETIYRCPTKTSLPTSLDQVFFPLPLLQGESRFIQALLTISSRHIWYLPAAQMHYDLMWGSIRAAAASYYRVTKPLPFSSWGVTELSKRKYRKTRGSNPVPCFFCSWGFTRCLLTYCPLLCWPSQYCSWNARWFTAAEGQPFTICGVSCLDPGFVS